MNTFKYDPFGRRVEKISPTTTSIFVYDGDNLVETTNGSGSEVASYTQGPNVDENFAMQRGTTTSYYEQDGLESVTSLTNSAGSVVQTYAYDSSGNQTTSSGSMTNFLRYTAREFDTETSLYFNRSRYYDPAVGRFLSEDPIRFDGGGNFYLYASDQPTLLSDPSGLSSEDVQRIQASCMQAVQDLTDAGLRYPGTGHARARWDDFLVLFQYFGKSTHYQGCKSQAALVKPVLENPTRPYDARWTFNPALLWGGSHTVVVGVSSNIDDPEVLCDPWRGITWTAPAPQIPMGWK